MLTKNTILADAVGRTFISEEEYCREAVLKGYQTAKRQGFGRAAFLARIYQMFGDNEKKDHSWVASYLLGTVLYNDVAALRSMQKEVEGAEGVVAGKEVLLNGLMDVLREDGLFEKILPYNVKDSIPLSAKGAFSIANAYFQKIEVKS